ncbi:hypothetical protein E6H27_01495 [Candidatus Bathyarchaeota archaeon]|nr:MAG: hypothetical protein E6H27_01495 [Candidatus Bathyarchaeota archaeon]
MDTRFLLFGLLANLVEIGWVLWGLAPQGIVLLLRTTVIVASIILTVIGLLRKGFVSADAAGLMIFGIFPIWVFGFLSLTWSIVGYYEDLSRCQIYSVGIASALYDCQQAQYDLYLFWLFVASLTIAAVVTFVLLFRLRKLSMQN